MGLEEKPRLNGVLLKSPANSYDQRTSPVSFFRQCRVPFQPMVTSPSRVSRGVAWGPTPYLRWVLSSSLKMGAG